MSKRKPLDKEQARERRNRLLASAAAAELSLTEGVREMRAIAGMTQEEFARHRGVSTRVIKAVELGQGNPTVATLNRIGQFFGLEVAFVPITHASTVAEQPSTALAELPTSVPPGLTPDDFQKAIKQLQENFDSIMHRFSAASDQLKLVRLHGEVENMGTSFSENIRAVEAPSNKKKKK
jgi:transcriptional regulator with XRE-family HTH domain